MWSTGGAQHQDLRPDHHHKHRQGHGRLFPDLCPEQERTGLLQENPPTSEQLRETETKVPLTSFPSTKEAGGEMFPYLSAADFRV